MALTENPCSRNRCISKTSRLLIISLLQAFTNELANRRRILSFHIFVILQKAGQPYRFRRQREYLKIRSVKGQQLFADEAVPGQDVLIKSDSE